MEVDKKDHYAKIEWPGESYRVLYEGLELAKSDKGLKLLEFHGNFNIRPILYFPNDCIAMSSFERSETKTHCPLKGEASYFNLIQANESVKDALWTYAEPLAGVTDIKGFSAFNLKKGFEIIAD